MATVHSLHPNQIAPLPSPGLLKKSYPLDALTAESVDKSRQNIRQILDGTDKRLLFIIGPCSIHDVSATLEYAAKLKELAEEVDSSLFLGMRVHFEKPRTALGWKGFLHDPYLDGSCDIASGLSMTRKLLLEIASLGVPICTELLDPLFVHHFSDLISWGCIGARTSASQPHRQMASALHMPIAFKNTTDGNISTAVHGALSASRPHRFACIDQDGKLAVIHSSGNSHSHIVLRGGEEKPNYDPQSIAYALEKLKESKLPQRLLIDCSHDNSSRKLELQPFVFQSALRQHYEGNHAIRGVMLESHLFAGNQMFSGCKSTLQYAVSLTDPCIDWDTTYGLVHWAHKLLSGQLVDDVPEKSALDNDPLYAQFTS